METTAGAVFIILSVLFAANNNPTTAAASPPPMPTNSCADEILLVSPCLPYISQPPNDLDVNVTPKCCQVLSSVVAAGSGACLCYLIRDPAMLGFLVNTTRLLSLSSVCDPKQSAAGNASSLASICSAPSPLPPLQDTGDSINQHPFVSTASPARSPRLAPSRTPPDHAAASTPKAADDDVENGPSETPPAIQWFINSAAALSATSYCLISSLVYNLLLFVFSGLLR